MVVLKTIYLLKLAKYGVTKKRQKGFPALV